MDDAAHARLKQQWPKQCRCCKTIYDSVGEWGRLVFAYTYTDAFATQEARHCACGSTLVIYTEIHNLAEE